MVKIGINTGLAHLSGNREEDELLSAYDVHKNCYTPSNRVAGLTNR
jgi:hypothetical protein